MELFVILMSTGLGSLFVGGAILYKVFAPKTQRYSLIQKRRMLNELTSRYEKNIENAGNQDELDELEETYRLSYKEIESHK